MGNIAVRAENIGKQFRIGRRQQYGTLRDSLVHAASSPLRWTRRVLSGTPRTPNTETIWALEDISFDIKHGELVGIIGRNGAGKSTLLKILSRITEPTRGRALIYGRVGSLLEVGTGFHPELTGRENVYLNGAILGMRKREIEQHFDAIVEFSEVSRFIDTPVKRYSSGMYLRLAFAVAAHLQPEILIVDEVLAVGDSSFQKKCLAKMEEVGGQGRTVLFVSHNMQAVTRLCKRAIFLEGGYVRKDGSTRETVSAYLDSGFGTTAMRDWPEIEKAPGNDIVRLRGVRVRTDTGEISDAIDIRRPVGIEIEWDVLKSGHSLTPLFTFRNEEGMMLFVCLGLEPEWRKRTRPAGRYTSTAWIPGNFLSEGTIMVGAEVCTENPHIPHFVEYPAVAFQVVDSLDGDSARGDYGGPMPGVIRPVLKWNTKFMPADSLVETAR
ncbi:MAG: ABC transporter ATP-binding protein [Candidatus Korobacteraceae bacterium]